MSDNPWRDDVDSEPVNAEEFDRKVLDALAREQSKRR